MPALCPLQLEAANNRWPTKLIFVPDAEHKQLFLRRPLRLLWKRTRLFFVCDLSSLPGESGQDGEGYLLKLDTKLLRTIKPLLVMSLTLLKILLGAVGLPPFVLPIPQGLCSSSYTAALVEHCSGQVEDVIKGMADSEDGDDPTDSFANVTLGMQELYDLLIR